MSKNDMIQCLIAFILGWLIARMMGNGFSVGAQVPQQYCRCPPGQYWDTLMNNCLFIRTQVDTCANLGNDECVKSWEYPDGSRTAYKCTMDDKHCVKASEQCRGDCLNGEDRTLCTDFCI